MLPGSPSSSPARYPVSAVIPALDEEDAVSSALEGLALQEDEPRLEVILADGGSTDRTVARFEETTAGWPARGWAARVVVSSRAGRAAQMNAGAREASGEALLFLHADTRLGPGATRAIVTALGAVDVVGGGFRHRFRERGIMLRVISAWATARSRLRHIHYGDQAIFARRAAFEGVGGYPEVPLFEDLRLARALRARGRVVTLPLAAETSARRLLVGGVLRTAGRFFWLKARYALGVDPEDLRAGYPDIR